MNQIATAGNYARFSDYLIAIELNNVGVNLLEAGAYRPAMATLKASVEVMKQVVCPTPSLSEAGILHALNARKRLNHVEDFTRSSSAYIFSRGEGFQVRQDDQEYANSWDGEAPPTLSNPVFIDPSETSEDNDLNPDMESAILFYNLGLAELLCMHEQGSNKNLFLQGALDLFEMAYSITMTDSLTVMNISLEDIRAMGATRVFLAILLLNSIIRVKEALGKHFEANETCQQLVRFELAVMKKEDLNMDYVEVASAAPAA